MSSIRREIHTVKSVLSVCVGLLLCALFLTAYSSRNPHVARVGSRMISELVMPVSQAVFYVRTTFLATLDSYVLLVGTEEENVQLRAELDSLKTNVDLAHELEIENVRLRNLLGLVNAHKGVTVTAASVIGGDPGGWTHSIAINQGSSAGVEVGMGVIHPRGVVGQVVSVSSHGARVLLVDDPASSVDVILQESRARGLLEGTGSETTTMQFVDKSQLVKEGDRVVTSGMDLVFPKGMLVGFVRKVSYHVGDIFKQVEVRPSIEFSKLEEVLVVNVAKPTASSSTNTGQK